MPQIYESRLASRLPGTGVGKREKLERFQLFLPGQVQSHWFREGHLGLARSIIFQGKRIGTVYIRF